MDPSQSTLQLCLNNGKVIALPDHIESKIPDQILKMSGEEKIQISMVAQHEWEQSDPEI